MCLHDRWVNACSMLRTAALMLARVLFQYKNHFSRYRDLRYKAKMVMRSSYLYDRKLYNDKTASLYWNCPPAGHSGPQVTGEVRLLCGILSGKCHTPLEGQMPGDKNTQIMGPVNKPWCATMGQNWPDAASIGTILVHRAHYSLFTGGILVRNRRRGVWGGV